MKRDVAPMRAIEREIEGQQVYCGPAAISLATGISIEVVLPLCNKVLNRKVRGMFTVEMQAVLSHLGYASDYERIMRRPLWRVHTLHPTIILTTGHWVVKDGLRVADQCRNSLIGEHWARSKTARGILTIWRKAS